jgi:hypothetical protein
MEEKKKETKRNKTKQNKQNLDKRKVNPYCKIFAVILFYEK